MNISKFRKEAGLTQEQLAKKLKVSPSTISAWETGKSEPTEKDILKLNDLFGEEIENERTSTFKTELDFMHLAVILIVPAIFFILNNINYMDNIINTYKVNSFDFVSFLTELKSSLIINSFVFYSLYIVFVLINEIYYKLNRLSALTLTVAIEICFFLINCSKFLIFEVILFFVPIAIGVVQIALLLKNRK